MKIKIKLLVSILFFHLLSADSGYNTIYLMEFENMQNDFTNSHLTEALPDLIKENYKFREDIRVEYAGDIRPYLKPTDLGEKNSIRGLIINGRFQTINDEFFVEFEAYDIQDWKRLVSRRIFCPVNDIICVHDGFLMAIEKSISPFLTNALDIDATISNLEQYPKREIPKSHDLDNNSNNGNLDNLSNLDESGSNLGLDSRTQKQGQYGDRYYREFYFADISPDPNFSKKQNSESLITILDQILTNPYNVLIGELSLYPDPDRAGNMRGEIPITYSVRSALTQELFTSLPHDKLMDANGNVILQFPNSSFIFDELLLEKLALMKYQLMPVIFFNNRIGGIQFIILDSWKEKYKYLEFQKISMFTENQFKPLFALTPGSDNIQLNLDVSSQEVEYNFSIPHEAIGDYTKVTVKFMPEVELDALLAGQGRTN
ncbi:hypothetical protein EB821_04495 [Candidatus Marinimicrobia bacterium PRS2]|nr:hypothetical protein EB821_04495 [Candidatus Marinimicrobia bacterium PRS2]